MSTSQPDHHKQDLVRRLEYFKLRRRLQAHSLPWLIARWLWVGMQRAWLARRAHGSIARLNLFNADRKREREAERLDRIRNPHRYRGRD